MPERLISVILPIYNQEDHIKQVVDEYEQALARIPNPHELLLVVNNSRDRSLEICQGLAERYPAIRVIHTEQGGWGWAVRLGLSESKGDLLCFTNSARTMPEDLLLLLLYAVAVPNAVIKANRKIRESWQRRLGSLLYNLECRSLFDLPYWDVNGTPKVFPRQYDALLNMTSNDDLLDAEFNIICRQNNYRMLEVPIFSTRRHGGISTTSYRSAIKLYLGVYRLWRNRTQKI